MNKIVDIIRLAGAFLFNKLVATSKKPAHTTDSAVEPIDDTATTATAVDKIVMNENAHVVKHSHELQVWQPVRPGLPSADRISSGQGYHSANIRLLCCGCMSLVARPRRDHAMVDDRWLQWLLQDAKMEADERDH